MAAIQNDRDILLQAASPRVVPVKIPIDQIEGLGPALMGLKITASDNVFYGMTGATTPATITLTVEKLGGLTGFTAWQVISGSATLAQSGDTCVITGSTMTGRTLIVRARVGYGGQNYDAQITINKLGSLSGQEAVNLATQITGQLSNTNVTGLKALALLDSVSLSNPVQVVGDLAASRIGVGVLAAGVIYAGTVNVGNLVGDTITGKNLAGTEYIYIAGTNAAAPLVMQRIGTDEAGIYLSGSLQVSRSDGISSFTVSRQGNLDHGNISLGVTASFKGSSFSIYNSTIGAPTFQTSGAGGIVLQHDSIQMKNAAGTALLTVASARTTIRSNFLALPQPSDVGAAVNGDMCILAGEVVVRIGGIAYKLNKTAI